MPGSYPAAQLKNVSVAGWPKWKRKPMRLPTRRAGTPSNSIRSRAAISRQHLRRSKSVPPTHAASSMRSGKSRMRTGTPIAGSGPCLTDHSTSSAVGGQPSRRPLSAVNRRRGRRGVRQQGEPRKTRRLRQGRENAGASDIRFPPTIAPPLTRAIGTHVGVVFFIGMDGELVDPATMSAFYFPMNEGGEYVWASWRPGALEELVTTWPARTPPGQDELDRGWWMPTLEELRNARRDAKSRRHARQRRDGKV